MDYEPDPLFVEKYLDNPPVNPRLFRDLELSKDIHIEEFKSK